MLGGIFRKIFKEDSTALFTPFYRAIQNSFSILNRILSGGSYITLSGNTNITTPILTNSNIDTSNSAPLSDFAQVATPPADVLLQISEVDYTPLNVDIPTGYTGALAYGSYNNSSSTLYYWKPTDVSNIVDGAVSAGSWQLVKLGWAGGTGTYNNNSTVAQSNTGWCHGTGDYTITTSNDFVDIQFDYITVISTLNGEKDVATSVGNNPPTQYNVRINPAVTGLNGIDSRTTFTSSSGYYVWFVHNPTTLQYGGMLSPFSSSVLIPEGYTHVQRLGWVSATSGVLSPSIQLNDKFQFITKNNPLATQTANLAKDSSSNINLITNTVPESVFHPLKSFIGNIDLVYNISSVNLGTVSSAYLEYGPVWDNLITGTDIYRGSQVIGTTFSNSTYTDYLMDIPVMHNSANNWQLVSYMYNRSTISGTVTVSSNIYVYGMSFRNMLLPV